MVNDSKTVDKPKFRPWLSLRSRHMECVTARLRIGHVSVRSHMHRFNMSDSETCTTCHVPDTVTHYLIYCRQYTTVRCALRKNLHAIGVNLNVKNILGGGDYHDRLQKRILNYLVRYINETDRLQSL